MPYCTQTDLVNKGWEPELIQLTDGTGTGHINATVLGVAQTQADAEINQYLRVKGYPADGSLVSSDLKTIAMDLTRFHCYSMAVPEIVQAAYDRQISRLEDFVKGLIEFDFVAAKTETQTAGDAAFNAADTVFTASVLSTY